MENHQLLASWKMHKRETHKPTEYSLWGSSTRPSLSFCVCLSTSLAHGERHWRKQESRGCIPCPADHWATSKRQRIQTCEDEDEHICAPTFPFSCFLLLPFFHSKVQIACSSSFTISFPLATARSTAIIIISGSRSDIHQRIFTASNNIHTIYPPNWDSTPRAESLRKFKLWKKKHMYANLHNKTKP